MPTPTTPIQHCLEYPSQADKSEKIIMQLGKETTGLTLVVL